MADVPKAAVSASEMLLRIILLGKSLWEQKGEENPQVEGEMSLFLQNLEDNIQVLNTNTVGLKNSATCALEVLHQDLREAAKEAHKILGKGFFDSIWDGNRVLSEVRLLRQRVVTLFQATLLFVALTVEIKGQDNQDEFKDALLRLQNLLRAQTITSASALKDVRKQELENLWPLVFGQLQDSEPHKIDEGIFYIKATEAQTDDITDFFVHVLEQLEKEKARRAPPAAAAAPAPLSTSKKMPAMDTLKWYHDPITWDLMCDPVKANDGRTYDRWTFIDHGSSMTRSPFDRREDRPLKIEFDDIDVRSRLFRKFPEQQEEFRNKRLEYRNSALALAKQPLAVEALVMLNHVLTWAENDTECKVQRDAISRIYPNLTLEKIAEFKEVFTTLDAGSIGSVTLGELGVALRTLGSYCSPAQLQVVIRAVGAPTGPNGTLDLPLFLAMMAGQNEVMAKTESLSPKLTLEQLARYRNAFSSFDTDGDGSLTLEELGTAMRLLGNNMSQLQLREVMTAADTDCSGTLDFAEFMSLLSEPQAGPQVEVILTQEQMVQYTQVFVNFDGDGDGSLNAMELASAMVLLGTSISVSEAQEVINEVDLDGNGSLNLVEFLIWMGRHLQSTAAAANRTPRRGPPFSAEDYLEVFQLQDQDGDGLLSFEEFVTATRSLGGDPVTDEQLLEEFKVIDTDGNGTIDGNEYVAYMTGQAEAQLQPASHVAFTPEEVASLKEKFDLLDVDGDGIISPEEVGPLMWLLGERVSAADLEAFVRNWSSAEGGWNFGDFLNMLASGAADGQPAEEAQLTPEQLEEWRLRFRMFDRNSDGRITVEELVTVVGVLGHNMSQAQLEDIVQQGDQDGDGTLDFEEFVRVMTRL